MDNRIKYKNRKYATVIRQERIKNNIIQGRINTQYSPFLSIFPSLDIFEEVLKYFDRNDYAAIRRIDYHTYTLFKSRYEFLNNRIQIKMLGPRGPVGESGYSQECMYWGIMGPNWKKIKEGHRFVYLHQLKTQSVSSKIKFNQKPHAVTLGSKKNSGSKPKHYK
jgi:hypothetical protein